MASASQLVPDVEESPTSRDRPPRKFLKVLDGSYLRGLLRRWRHMRAPAGRADSTAAWAAYPPAAPVDHGDLNQPSSKRKVRRGDDSPR